MPDTDILNEEQVAKVAETVEANYPLRLYLSRFEIDIDALCRTVRAAWARERTVIAVNSELIEGNHAAHVALDAAGVKREDVVWEGPIQHVTEYPVCDRIEFLREQLAQMARQLTETEEIRQGLKALAGEYENEISQLKLTRDDLQSRLAQVVKERDELKADLEDAER